jgi:CubicO group peptidase (beta-lactamase class C family)
MTSTTFPRSTPSAEGVDARGIRSFLDALDTEPDVELHSLMLLRHGAVIAEGWWAPYGPQRPHLLYSLSKSFTSTALGLATAEGLVRLDDTVLSHFPELDDEITDPRSRRMLVRHVAAMASGHLEETIDRATATDPTDLVRGFLLTPPDADPGSVFAYNQPCTFALAAIVQRAAGMPLTEYLRPRLLNPLGIGEVGWLRDSRSLELGYSGLHAATDAIAKLGQLYLQRGRWGDTQLLPPEWVDEATKPRIATPGRDWIDWEQGYGFQFWTARHGYRGDGAYGQFCVVLPEHDVVLAITGQSPDMQAVLSAAWEHLLPAIDRPTDGPTDAAADDSLRDALRAAALPATPGVEPPESASYTAAQDTSVDTLVAVSVSPSPTGIRVTLTERDVPEPLEFGLGIGVWAVTDALAASGGIQPDGSLRIDVILVETPHRLSIIATEGAFRARWATEPLHALPLGEMRMPR